LPTNELTLLPVLAEATQPHLLCKELYVKSNILPVLICPSCLPDEVALSETVVAEDRGDIIEGSLNCSRCGRAYPIRKGVAFLDPGAAPEKKPDSRYESAPVLSSYLWSHFGDLLDDSEASDAYVRWAGLMRESSGMCVDIGGAVGRFAFEMTRKSDFVIGLDNSVTFVETARDLMLNRGRRVFLMEEGFLTREVALRLPAQWDMDKIEFVVADALALPFRSRSFSALAGLNLIDKVPRPMDHFKEMNRTALERGAQFLFSDPFSWSKDVAPEESWLGGKETGPYAGRGHENVQSLLSGATGDIAPPWKIEENGHIWWKIRTHANHFELIRSRFVKAAR
jgi:SAM-dependent methyltransferase